MGWQNLILKLGESPKIVSKILTNRTHVSVDITNHLRRRPEERDGFAYRWPRRIMFSEVAAFHCLIRPIDKYCGTPGIVRQLFSRRKSGSGAGLWHGTVRWCDRKSRPKTHRVTMQSPWCLFSENTNLKLELSSDGPENILTNRENQ